MAVGAASESTSLPAIPDEAVREAVDRYVSSLSHENEIREEVLPTILDSLNTQKVQLLDVVVHLEKQFSDATNPTGRRFAVRLLADCISGCSAQLQLNAKHIETFATFFCSKLEDWQSVEGTIGGLLAIFRRHEPTLRQVKSTIDGFEEDPFVTGIAKSLFREVHVPSHTQAVRQSVLQLIMILVEEWPDELERLNNEDNSLGEGVSMAVDEEKDPRNLLLSFTLIKRVLESYPASCVPPQQLSTMFETLSSYFPITFQPPKEDKIGISGEELRLGLSNAFAATKRLAEYTIPFLLDSSTDISGGDSLETVGQAMDMLSACFDAYGADIAKANVAKVLKVARDQVCRTANPCPQKFADCLQHALAAAMKGTPQGLHPKWLAKDVDPALGTLAMDAAKDESEGLACTGSRRLLLGAAAAHPVILERIWGLVIPPLLAAGSHGHGEGSAGQLKPEALQFVLSLVRLVKPPGQKQPSLAARQLKNVLAGACLTLLRLRGDGKIEEADDCNNSHGDSHVHSHGHTHGDGSECCGHGHGSAAGGSAENYAATAFELVGLASTLAAADACVEGFLAMRVALLGMQAKGGADVPPAIASWAATWQARLQEATAVDAETLALTGAVKDIVVSHSERAAELAAVLPATADSLQKGGTALPVWMEVELPRLLAATALSLAGRATTDEAEDKEAAGKASDSLVAKIAALCSADGACATAALQACVEALESSTATTAATAFFAKGLLTKLDLPASLKRLASGLEADGRVLALRNLVQALSQHLDAAAAASFRKQVVEDVTKADSTCLVVFLPAILPEIGQKDWKACTKLLPTLHKCITSPEHAALEPLALEALEALVTASPEAGVEDLLQALRAAFHDLIPTPKAVAATVSPHAAKGAARCWAAAAAALLRRGGLAKQAAEFLEGLLGALQTDGPVTPFVPLAFLVLMPPQFGSSAAASEASGAARGGEASRAKLSSLALQQLSRTMLPSLISHSKVKGSSSTAAPRAALESAITLLSALPSEVAVVECKEDLRWAVLTGLKRVNEASIPSDKSPSDDATFAVQVMQLMVRACDKKAAWVEDDLQSVIPPLTSLCIDHRIPLVRLGALQVLRALIEESHGHLMPFKKVIDKATRRAVEDRRREVRLVAVACLNSWHCAQYAGD
eukprot:TRINITY_DN91027_c0_g1_i1.p1 TRINITY_DN91027_c0_g1~~TRINITY_DN91027_c0_g1_i1.p1  ORF type:complete len:1151 (-),score=303.66 TRINITY_DN91027_c0_g1_i1:134-3586(-)